MTKALVLMLALLAPLLASGCGSEPDQDRGGRGLYVGGGFGGH